MKNSRWHGAEISGAALVRVFGTDGFQSYIDTARVNGDGSHAEIVSNACSGVETYSSLFDGMLHLENFADFLSGGGKVFLPKSQPLIL